MLSPTTDTPSQIATPAVAALLARLLGWDAERQAREVSAYRADVERDRACLASERASASRQ
jgi:glycerol-3-phosphate dehydrogenase